MYRYHPFYQPAHRHTIPPHSYFRPFHSHYRSFPQVETKTFMSSSDKTLVLLDNAKTVLDRIKSDKNFAFQLMNAAQKSNNQEVHKLITSTGIKVQPIVTFNPDGMRLVFDQTLGEVDCCHVIVIVRWREM
ncbi:hypothetical protein [Rossellomorea aquimaris]|uniref:hypothetical protein n=1 Tax=Rossellomorea aquimaris TaxID=189382 RepID=UPI0007D06C41|nr:hypothetical protein [Rossellomorea aquimaris]